MNIYKRMEKRDPLYTVDGTGIVINEKDVEVPPKDLKTKISLELSIPLLDGYPKELELISQKCIFTLKCITELVIIDNMETTCVY